MKRHLGAVTLTVALAALSSPAAPPVAVRVETVAIRSEGDATLISVTVQVAPEDRSRLGRDVWVQCELLRGGQRLQRLARALDLDERGQAGFEVAWAAGDYDLRVTIEGSEDRAAGLWVGPLSVPAMGPAAPAAASAATPPTHPQPSPPPEPTAELPVAGTAQVIAAPAVAAAAGAAAVEPVEPAPAARPEVAAPPAAVSEPAVELVPAEPPPSQLEISSTSEPVPAPEAKPPAAETAPATAATGIADVAAGAAEVEVAEAPLATRPEVAARGEVVAEPAVESPPLPQSAAASPAEVQPGPAVEPAPAPAQPTPAAAAGVTGTSWAAANPGMTDATVFVTERNRPILGLGPGAFTLRIGGSNATVAAVGDAASAPLNLALVADVAPDAGELTDELARQLGRFSLRARNGGDLMVVTAAEPRPGWGAGADAITRWADGATAGRSDDLAGLVAAAAEAAAGRRGRSVLVVVTDGSDACGKAAWKEASAAAEAAGVPVFTIGLRDDGFDDQARAGLTRIADSTGGRSYFLGSAGMSGMTLDYLGELIDASYALAFRQAVAGAGPRELKVEAVNRDWQVNYPRRIP